MSNKERSVKSVSSNSSISSSSSESSRNVQAAIEQTEVNQLEQDDHSYDKQICQTEFERPEVSEEVMRKSLPADMRSTDLAVDLDNGCRF